MSTSVRIVLSDGDGNIIHHEGYSLNLLAEAFAAEVGESGKIMAAAALNDSVNEMLAQFHYEIRVSLVRLIKTGSTTP